MYFKVHTRYKKTPYCRRCLSNSSFFSSSSLRFARSIRSSSLLELLEDNERCLKIKENKQGNYIHEASCSSICLMKETGWNFTITIYCKFGKTFGVNALLGLGICYYYSSYILCNLDGVINLEFTVRHLPLNAVYN